MLDSGGIMSKMLNIINKHKYIFLLIIIYLLFFVQIQQIFFYGDDFQVLYPYHGIRNFTNIFSFCIEKMIWFWNEWSGRIVGHFTVSFGLSFFGIQFFKILNPIMTFIMVYLCLKILSLFRNFDFKKYLFLLSFIVIGFNIYISRETLYWAYAGILYIWGFNMLLLIVYFVYKYHLLNKKIPVLKLLLFGIICFLQTFILEQFSFMLISFFIFMLIKLIKEKKDLKQITILLVITTVGFLLSAINSGNVVRTEPLIQELAEFTNFHIILGKIMCFFNYILNPKIFGVYFSIFALLVHKKYLLNIKNEKSILKKIPSFILVSYFFCFIISSLFKIDIFNFSEVSDSMYSIYSLIYLLSVDLITEYNLHLLMLIIRIIYFISIISSVFYMLIKTLWKENKFLVISVFVTFLAAVIPIIFIRFIGTRYYLFFVMSLLIISINYIFDLKKENVTLIDYILFSFVLPFKYAIPISLLICIVLLMNKKIYDLLSKYSIKLFLFTCVFILIFNITTTIYGYNYNKKIYNKNNEILENSQNSYYIEIDRIPKKYNLYTWHSNAANFMDDGTYYGHYLNDFYKDYYNFDPNNVVIKGGYENYAE